MVLDIQEKLDAFSGEERKLLLSRKYKKAKSDTAEEDFLLSVGGLSIFGKITANILFTTYHNYDFINFQVTLEILRSIPVDKRLSEYDALNQVKLLEKLNKCLYYFYHNSGTTNITELIEYRGNTSPKTVGGLVGDVYNRDDIKGLLDVVNFLEKKVIVTLFTEVKKNDPKFKVTIGPSSGKPKMLKLVR